MKRVYAYIRVSTQKQGVHGSSLQEQRSAIESYAQRNDLEIVEWFEEQETAAKRGRPAFTRLMRSLTRGKADGVVMHKIDRGARNFWDWAAIGDLIEKGIAVHFAHESLDLNTRGGRLAADIQAVVAADYIRNLRDEVKKGMYGRLKQGIYPFKAPVGYLDAGPGKLKEIDPVRGPLVREAFELYATGDFNLKTLRAELHRRGLRAANGKPLALNTMSYILNNPFYFGLMHLKRSNQTFEGRHPALISKSLYDKVQVVLRSSRLAGEAWTHKYLFRHLIRCQHCGHVLIGERQKERYTYYRCHNPACGPVCLSETALDKTFLEIFSAFEMTEEELGDFRDMLGVLRRTADEDRRDKGRGLQLAVAQVDEKISRLTDALLDLTIGKDIYEKKNVELLAQRRVLMERSADSSQEQSRSALVAEYLEFATTAHFQYKVGDPAEKRRVVETAVSNFAGSGKKPVVALKSPFQEMLNDALSQLGGPQRGDGRTRAKRIFDIFVDAAERELGLDILRPSPQRPDVHAAGRPGRADGSVEQSHPARPGGDTQSELDI